MPLKLYLDVDGVINPTTASARIWDDFVKVPTDAFGFDLEMNVSAKMISSLLELCREFDIEIVWATTWIINNRCETNLVPIYGLPGGLRQIDYEASTEYGERYSYGNPAGCGKLPGVMFDAGENDPIIWLDDCLYGEDYAWAEERTGPTLLIRTPSDIGLTPKDIVEMREFARDIQS